MFPKADPPPFPFCAVVRQERVKRVLLLHAVNPRISSVLISGETGAAKTTLVRGLDALLPHRKKVVVPVHVTEDRLLGALDTAAAIRQAEKKLFPGLLAEADGQMMAIDDVNLMSEHLMKTILQTAENGWYRMEREGVSEIKPAQFLLFGTINALYSSEIKHHLLDHWGLYVRTEPVQESIVRQEIIRRCLAFERNEALFTSRYEAETLELMSRIDQAARLLPSVHAGRDMLRLAAEISREANCEGHRAEIVLVETARAMAAWEEQTEVQSHHLQEAAGYVVPHRMRSVSAPRGSQTENSQPSPDNSELTAPKPPLADNSDSGLKDHSDVQHKAEMEGLSHLNSDLHPNEKFEKDSLSDKQNSDTFKSVGALEIVESVGRDFEVFRYNFTPLSKPGYERSGKRNKTEAGVRPSSGRYIRAIIPRGPIQDLALDATLRAAAPLQRLRRDIHPGAGEGKAFDRLRIEKSDLREKVRETRSGTALLFVVDASGSMNAAKRMKAVKGAVVSLLRDAYRQRDSVGLIAFRGDSAELMLSMTRSVELAERKLRTMPTGGKTPLSAALLKGADTLAAMMKRKGGLVPAMIIMTDGRANVSREPDNDPWEESLSIARRIAASGIQTLVIDTESGFVKLGFANTLAKELHAPYYRLEQLEAGSIERAVRSMLQ